jgi:hypothetical protein
MVKNKRLVNVWAGGLVGWVVAPARDADHSKALIEWSGLFLFYNAISKSNPSFDHIISYFYFFIFG